MFNPGPDKLDLDTSSLVLQLLHGFHGVNSTAVVTLIRELPTEGLNEGFYFIRIGF